MARKSSASLAGPGSGKRKRKGVHAKSKTSKLKGSKLYKKKYAGQGR